MVIYEVDDSVLVQSYLDEEDIINSSALTVKKERRLSLLPHPASIVDHSQHSSAAAVAAVTQAVVDHDSHITQGIHHQHESQRIVHNNSEYDHVVDNNDYDDPGDHCDDDDDNDDDDGFDGHSDDHRDEFYENDDHGSFDPNRFQSFIAITPVEQQQQLLQQQQQTADVVNHKSQKRITRNSSINECPRVSSNANSNNDYGDHPHSIVHHIVSPPTTTSNDISSKVMMMHTIQRGRRNNINKNRKSKNIDNPIINTKDKIPKSVMNEKTSTKVTIDHNDNNNNADDEVNNDKLFTAALLRLTTTVVRNDNKVYTSLLFFTRALNKYRMLSTTLIRFETEVIPAISTILSNHQTLSKVSLVMKCD
jgi:hypothetical protein